MDFDILADIEAAGFHGRHPISELQNSLCREVPDQPGVYLIQRPNAGAPSFLAASIGGHFKGRNPTLPLSVLSSQWVPASCVVYIGKASESLRRRLRHYMEFGLGKPVGHWGGRCIWQLQDSGKFLVSWKVTAAADAVLFESQLIQEFKARYGRRPFANLRD